MSTKLLNIETQRRDDILNAALKQFAISGFDNASTNIIAKEAGISKALMFHYVKSKQELFLYVYDYFTELLDKEYFSKMDYSEGDIFKRFRQSYLLQIDLIKQYPWIFEFSKLTHSTSSDELNKAIEERVNKGQPSCDHDLFDGIDFSNFKEGLDMEKCKKIILWTNIGFSNQILDKIKNSDPQKLDYEQIVTILDDYLNELRKLFYMSTS
jgi:AcrR family transcriptional regulator